MPNIGHFSRSKYSEVKPNASDSLSILGAPPDKTNALNLSNSSIGVTLEIISQEFEKHKNNIFMPRIVSANKLKFNLFKENATLEKNKYGINEVKNEEYLDSASFDLMFIPFVGIDKGGYRLGYGGGYFDRSLGNISFTEKKPIIVGLGYDFQILEESFAESHDLKYDIVITQTRIHSYS